MLELYGVRMIAPAASGAPGGAAAGAGTTHEACCHGPETGGAPA